MYIVLGRVSIAMMKHHHQKQLPITEGNQSKKSKQKLKQARRHKQRPWRVAAYWFAQHGLLSLLFLRTQEYSGLGPSTSITKKLLSSLPTAQSSHFLSWVPSSQVILAHVRVT